MKEQESPPAMSTFPLGRRVAVCSARPVLILPVGRNPEGTMVTLAIPVLLESWTLVAITWNGPPVVFGAVYCPPVVMAPPVASCTLQLTPVFKEVFTVALKLRTPSGPNTLLGGETDTTSGATVTVAVAFWVVSAWLVAITWKVPPLFGAV